jgi:hypothetical protein
MTLNEDARQEVEQALEVLERHGWSIESADSNGVGPQTPNNEFTKTNEIRTTITMRKFGPWVSENDE